MTTTEPLTNADLGRAWRELPDWRWMPGMEALRPHPGGGVYSYRIDSVDGPWRPETFGLLEVSIGAYPDTTDHATVGCLHALAEEITGCNIDVLHAGGEFAAFALHAERGLLAETMGPTRAQALLTVVLQVLQ